MIAGLIGGLASVLLMAALRKWFPSRVTEQDLPPGENVETLRIRYGKWEFLFVFVFLVLSVTWTAVVYSILNVVSVQRNATIADAVFLLSPAPFMWLLPGMFIGMALSGACIDPVAKRLLGPQKREYDNYQELKFGRMARLKVRYVVSAICVPAVLLLLLLMHYRVVFTADEIRINRFFSPGTEVYRYADVTRILAAPATIAPNGNIHKEWRFVLYFSNGKRWNCQNDPSERDENTHKEIANYISRKSSLAIELKDVLKREDQ